MAVRSSSRESPRGAEDVRDELHVRPRTPRGALPVEVETTPEYHIERVKLYEGCYVETRRPRSQFGPHQWTPGQPLGEDTGKNRGVGEKSGP